MQGLFIQQLFCVQLVQSHGVLLMFNLHAGQQTDVMAKTPNARWMRDGCTRAEERLYLTRASSRNMWGANNYNSPSRFLAEVPEHLISNAGRAKRSRTMESRSPKATVTDADLVLGYLNPDYFLGGKMKLDMEGAERAIKEQIADPLGLDLIEAAYGIHRIVNAHMSDAVRFHVLHRGYDPRDFELLLFGGATAVHATGIGENLGTKSTIIPLAGLATVLSAFGIVNSDVIRTYSTSKSMSLQPETMEALEEIYNDLEKQGIMELMEDGFKKEDIYLDRIAYIRYHLQLTEIEVGLGSEPLNKHSAGPIIERFDRRYAELYGKNAGYK